jgi:[acyl-carrier-protein] S-malonyltransferase
MGKIAFVFPGQGAQYKGQGLELYNKFHEAKSIFDEADNVLGFKISDICFNGNEDELKRTDISQAAIFTTSCACLEVLKKFGIHADFAAGLSLGEYTALYCSGAFDFKTALKIVRKRGILMHDAVSKIGGSMAALLGLTIDEVKELLNEEKGNGFIDIANINCPGQIVVSGDDNAVDDVCKKVEDMGKRAVKLKTEGSFHIKKLAPAAARLKYYMKDFKINDFKVPVITNVTGDYIKSKEDLVDILEAQMQSSVLWEKTIRTMIDDGADTFIEVGPSRVLSGFLRRIDRNARSLNVEDIQSLNKTLNSLEVKYE